MQVGDRLRRYRTKNEYEQVKMAAMNVYIANKKDIVKQRRFRNEGSSQAMLTYGVRDGKKKLKKGKHLIGVDLQWNEKHEDCPMYKNVRLIV